MFDISKYVFEVVWYSSRINADQVGSLTPLRCFFFSWGKRKDDHSEVLGNSKFFIKAISGMGCLCSWTDGWIDGWMDDNDEYKAVLAFCQRACFQ